MTGVLLSTWKNRRRVGVERRRWGNEMNRQFRVDGVSDAARWSCDLADLFSEVAKKDPGLFAYMKFHLSKVEKILF